MQSLSGYRIKYIVLSLGVSKLFTIFAQLYPIMGQPIALYAVATTHSLTPCPSQQFSSPEWSLSFILTSENPTSLQRQLKSHQHFNRPSTLQLSCNSLSSEFLLFYISFFCNRYSLLISCHLFLSVTVSSMARKLMCLFYFYTLPSALHTTEYSIYVCQTKWIFHLLNWSYSVDGFCFWFAFTLYIGINRSKKHDWFSKSVSTAILTLLKLPYIKMASLVGFHLIINPCFKMMNRINLNSVLSGHCCPP